MADFRSHFFPGDHTGNPERSPVDERAHTDPGRQPGDPGPRANGPGVEAGAVILTDVHAFLGRFIAYPSKAAQIAHSLWVAHTHAMDAWESTPRIAFLSPEPKSGKTRALEVSESLVPRPVEAVNVTPAYLFRKVGDKAGRPTILFDEADTVFGPKSKKDNEEVRGLLNAGHRRGAVAGRCTVHGKTVKTEELPAYCAVAIAGLGEIPETILGRSVVIRMRRRAPGERVEPWRRRVHMKQGVVIRDRLAAWMASVAPALAAAWPDMPEGIADRDADVWEALFAIADAAGGDWPEKARLAALAVLALTRGGGASLGVRLLTDIREVFGARDVMGTGKLLQALYDLPESQWKDHYGKPFSDRRLSSVLKGYDIKSKAVWVEGSTLRGYTREDLWDAWSRYLPPLAPCPPQTAQGPQGPQEPQQRAGLQPQGSADGAARNAGVAAADPDDDSNDPEVWR